MGVLKKKINKYDKYIIEIESEELEASNLKSIEDVIITSKDDFENELHKSKELTTKLESRELEIKLKDLKLQEKDLEFQKTKSEAQELKETYRSKLIALERDYVNKSNELNLSLKTKDSEIE